MMTFPNNPFNSRLENQAPFYNDVTDTPSRSSGIHLKIKVSMVFFEPHLTLLQIENIVEKSIKNELALQQCRVESFLLEEKAITLILNLPGNMSVSEVIGLIEKRVQAVALLSDIPAPLFAEHFAHSLAM